MSSNPNENGQQAPDNTAINAGIRSRAAAPAATAAQALADKTVRQAPGNTAINAAIRSMAGRPPKLTTQQQTGADGQQAASGSGQQADGSSQQAAAESGQQADDAAAGTFDKALAAEVAQEIIGGRK